MLDKSTNLIAISLTMAFLAGAVLPFQATANANLGRALGHPLWGALTSLAVSTIVILPILLAVRAPAPAIGTALQGPWWLWVGGLLGAVYVGSAAAVTPRLGAGGFIACVVAGQMLAAILVDHFGWMGLPVRPINPARVIGVMLILAGVGLVQGLSTAKASVVVLP